MRGHIQRNRSIYQSADRHAWTPPKKPTTPQGVFVIQGESLDAVPEDTVERLCVPRGTPSTTRALSGCALTDTPVLPVDLSWCCDRKARGRDSALSATYREQVPGLRRPAPAPLGRPSAACCFIDASALLGLRKSCQAAHWLLRPDGARANALAVRRGCKINDRLDQRLQTLVYTTTPTACAAAPQGESYRTLADLRLLLLCDGLHSVDSEASNRGSRQYISGRLHEL